MKKLIFLASVVILGSTATFAQTSSSTLNKAANALGTANNALNSIGKISNIANTAKELSTTLGSTLGLNTKQKLNVTSILTNYIKSTNGISSLANSNAVAYASKLAGINTSTLGKLKTALTVAQYSKLLGLGGSSSSSTSSLLGGLTGGNKLSSSATSVLAGLLLNGAK